MSDDLPPMKLVSTDWETSCDKCAYQEEGGHYCLLHSVQVKNMDILRCDDWKEKEQSK